MGNTFSEKHTDHPAPAFIEQGEPAEEPITLRFSATTPGERLIPLLLLVSEVCIGYALLLGLAVSLNFAGDVNPLLPFWGLLLIMLSFYTASKLYQRYFPTGLARRVLEPLTWLLLILFSALFFGWLNNYAQSAPFLSFDWLRTLLHMFIPVTTANHVTADGQPDIQVNIIPAVQFVLLLISGLVGWRGHRLAGKHVISDEIDRLIKWGVICLVIVMVIFLFQFYVKANEVAFITRISPQVPALLTATFFVCVLTARALQNASYIRHFHRARLWGSAASQERIIWFSMLLLGAAIVTIALLLGHTAVVITHNHLPAPRKKAPPALRPLAQPGQGAAHTAPSLWLIVVLILLAALVTFLFCLFLWLRWQKLQRLAKQLKKQKVDEEKKEIDELHETVFNWSLFLAQLRASLLALLALLNPFRRRNRVGKTFDDLLLAEPGVRSIREVYRALLKKAASRGQARERDETPYEFGGHLGQQEELAGPELEAITEAYVLVRYSGTRPGKEDVTRVKQVWEALKQKWG